jgi:hypothetical protein
MPSPAIHTLHWGIVSPDAALRWVDDTAVLAGIWPAPIDEDACFSAAGFNDFAVPSDLWDAEFRGLLDRLVGLLKSYGPPTPRREMPLDRSLWERVVDRPPQILSWQEHLLAASESDSYPDCIIEFGRPPAMTLRTGLGHPILSLYHRKVEKVDLPALLHILAGEGRKITQTNLKWEHLVLDRQHSHAH